jgi:hypothetical protein
MRLNLSEVGNTLPAPVLVGIDLELGELGDSFGYNQ